MNYKTASKWFDKFLSIEVSCNLQAKRTGEDLYVRGLGSLIDPVEYDDYYIVVGYPNHTGHYSGIIYETEGECENAFPAYKENMERKYNKENI